MTMKKTLGLALLALLALTLSSCSEDDHTDEELTGQEIQDWNSAFSEKEDGKADTAGCSGVKVPDNGPFGGKIALTFDDGPGGSTTRKIMETLREFNAPATFFVLGRSVSSQDGLEIAKKIVADPLFDIASHSWSHPNMSRLGATEVAKQLDDTVAAIAEAGAEIGFHRFPYGASTCASAQASRDRGLTVAGWHIDSADWCFNAGNGRCPESTFRYVDDAMRDNMAGFILQQAKRKQGGVLLFHDTKSYTANALAGILEKLQAAGFEFVRLTDVETFPFLNGVDPLSFPFVGDGCSEDDDCGEQIESKAAFCLSGFCTINCEGYCPDRAGREPTFCAPDPTRNGTRGVCVSKSTPGNNHCAEVPGSVESDSDRFVGNSGARAANAEVCLPKVTE